MKELFIRIYEDVSSDKKIIGRLLKKYEGKVSDFGDKGIWVKFKNDLDEKCFARAMSDESFKAISFGE